MQEISDLSIAQWLILSCTQPNINCLRKICPHMRPLEALICVIIVESGKAARQQATQHALM